MDVFVCYLQANTFPRMNACLYGPLGCCDLVCVCQECVCRVCSCFHFIVHIVMFVHPVCAVRFRLKHLHVLYVLMW